MGFGEHLAQVTNNPTLLDEADRYTKVEINDIPIMYTNEGAICCIPKEEEVFAAAVVGSSGTGKSLLLSRITQFLFYQFKYNTAVMNDVSEETYKWSEPATYFKFKDTNKLHTNEEPCPSPMIYLYQNTYDLNVPVSFKKSYAKITIPFSEIIDNLRFYLEGVSPGLNLEKADMYIRNLKEDLKYCETPEQVKEILYEKLPQPGKPTDGYAQMRNKINNAFDALFKEEILDITKPECYYWMKLNKDDEELFMPFIALMKKRTIPSLITSNFINKKYKGHIFSFYINYLFDNNEKYFPNEKTFLVFDELKEVCLTDTEPAAQALGRVTARGRIKNLGLLYATQFYDRIPNLVKGAKLNYLFAFKQNNEEIANEIKKDFSLNKHTRDKLLKLKNFQCIAMTNNKFVLYRDNEKWETNEPQVGEILFPNCNSRIPGVK